MNHPGGNFFNHRPVPEIQNQAEYQGDDQSPERNGIHQGLVYLKPGEPRKKKTQIGVREVTIPKPFEDVEVPVGQRTVTKAIKNPQENP